jgi:hypothetical protein
MLIVGAARDAERVSRQIATRTTELATRGVAAQVPAAA